MEIDEQRIFWVCKNGWLWTFFPILKKVQTRRHIQKISRFAPKYYAKYCIFLADQKTRK